MKRKAISKLLRFEVFKRDGFVCQYCGAAPPGAVLQVDHIVAVAKGGDNDMVNLVTSCQPCNIGKGVRGLSVIPQSLADKAAEVTEREKQLSGYQAALAERRERLDAETWRVLWVLLGDDTTSVPQEMFRSVRMFVERLGAYAVIDAAEIALQAPCPKARVFRYFCGICWRQIKEEK